jgi:hypothetical protein
LFAEARQIMYAARKHIQDESGEKLESTYFTQTLLPDYLAAEKPPWADNVVFDDRGHFAEPHTRLKALERLRHRTRHGGRAQLPEQDWSSPVQGRILGRGRDAQAAVL